MRNSFKIRQQIHIIVEIRGEPRINQHRSSSKMQISYFRINKS